MAVAGSTWGWEGEASPKRQARYEGNVSGCQGGGGGKMQGWCDLDAWSDMRVVIVGKTVRCLRRCPRRGPR